MVSKISPRELVQHLLYIKNIPVKDLKTTSDKIKEIIKLFSEKQADQTSQVKFELTPPPTTNYTQIALLSTTCISSAITAALLANQFLTEEAQEPRDSLIASSAVASVVTAIGSLCLGKSMTHAQKVDALCRQIFTDLQQAIDNKSNIATVLHQVTSKNEELNQLELYPLESLAISSIDPEGFVNDFILGMKRLSLALQPFSKKIADVLNLLDSLNNLQVVPRNRQAIQAYEQLKQIASTVKATLSSPAQKELTRRLQCLEKRKPKTQDLNPIRIVQMIQGKPVVIYENY